MTSSGFPRTITIDDETARVLIQRAAVINTQRAEQGLAAYSYAEFARMILQFSWHLSDTLLRGA